MTAARPICLLATLLAAAPAGAQSLLQRTPNLSGDWVGTSGQFYFNFLHRFEASSAPERKITNAPTFTLAAGLPLRLLVGFNYATNSDLVPRYPNEWEFFGRHQLLTVEGGWPVDVGLQVGYNLAANGADGELSVGRAFGPVHPLAALRVMADPAEASGIVTAAGAGALLRLTRHLSVAGDVASMLDRPPGEDIAWSAGIHIAIPYSPHTLSLHAANTNAGTLQGSSRGGRTRYGFEFTIPFTPARWFSRSAPTATGDTATAGATVVRSEIRNFKFPGRIEVAVGTVVEWTNGDEVAHTVTSQDGAFASPTLPPGGVYRRRFDRPGTYPYYCEPHPYMKGIVEVRAP